MWGVEKAENRRGRHLCLPELLMTLCIGDLKVSLVQRCNASQTLITKVRSITGTIDFNKKKKSKKNKNKKVYVPICHYPERAGLPPIIDK
jgi:hypothetical protein